MQVAGIKRGILGLVVLAVLAGPAPVAAADAYHSDTYLSIRKDLLAVRGEVDSSVSYAFSLDPASMTVVVDTNGPTTAFEPIASKYPGLIEIRAGSVLSRLAGRMADTSPFYGGAAINTINDRCTSGWVGTKNGTRYLTTAGHCFATGSTIRANDDYGQGLVMGTVTNRDYPAYEAELISGASYSPRIYNGVSGDDSSNVPIYGRLLDAVGTSGICRTGFKSGNSCGWTLDDLNASFCDADGCTQYLNAYHGGIAPAAGDSGGPIYQPYNGGALLSGTIVGLSCFFVYCTYYGEKVGTILGRWDLTLVCSGTCQIH